MAPARRRLWLAASLAALVLVAAAAELAVPRVIRDAHGGTSLPVLNRMLEGRDVHPVEYYRNTWRTRSRRALAVLAGLWVLVAVASRPRVAGALGKWLGPAPAEPTALPSYGRRLLVGSLAAVITAGSAAEILLDPPYAREHWPFSQYQMYSERSAPKLSMRRLFGVTAGTGREIPLVDKRYIFPFDHSRFWFSLDRLDKSPDRERLLTIALSDCLRRYEARRREGLHDGPPMSALRLYRLRWNAAPAGQDRIVERELLWEVKASTPPTPSR
jgi:hypothetical protein